MQAPSLGSLKPVTAPAAAPDSDRLTSSYGLGPRSEERALSRAATDWQTFYQVSL
jgi:hypothetical protein